MDEQAYDYLDRELQAAAGPDPEALTRVESRLAFLLAREADAAIQRPPPSGRTSRSATWLAAVAAAAACLTLGTVLGSYLTARGAPGGALGSLVLPGSGGGAGSSGGPGGFGSGGGGSFGGPCSLAPSVQLQGRGLAASGFAQVEGATASPGTLTFQIQDRADPGNANASVQAKVKALQNALAGAGVPADAVRVTSVSLSVGDPTAKLISSNASVQVRIKDADQESKAIAAGLASPGVSSYSTFQGQLAQASPQANQAAVAAATAQAKELAANTARAAGVTLGPIETVVITPPTACGSTFVVQATITYGLK